MSTGLVKIVLAVAYHFNLPATFPLQGMGIAVPLLSVKPERPQSNKLNDFWLWGPNIKFALQLFLCVNFTRRTQ